MSFLIVETDQMLQFFCSLINFFYFSIPMSKTKSRFDYFCKCLKLKVFTPCLDLYYSIPKMINSLENYLTFTVNLLLYPVFRNIHHHICLPFISHRCYFTRGNDLRHFWGNSPYAAYSFFYLFVTAGASISCPVTAQSLLATFFGSIPLLSGKTSSLPTLAISAYLTCVLGCSCIFSQFLFFSGS